MKEAVIVSAIRTPVGKYMGALKDVQAYDLAALVLNEVLRRANLKPAWIDDVIIGQSYQSGEYVNIARMALLKAGWPESIPGVTMDRRCCTGLDTLRFAGMMIQSGQAQMVVAGADGRRRRCRKHEQCGILHPWRDQMGYRGQRGNA